MSRLYATAVDLDQPLIAGMVDAALDCICKDEDAAILYRTDRELNRKIFNVFTDATRYDKFQKYIESRGILSGIYYDIHNVE